MTAGLLGLAPPAAAAPDAPPSPGRPSSTVPSSGTPTPTPQPLSLDDPGDGLVTRFPLTVRGGGEPGDTVAVSAGASATAANRCEATIDSSGRFSCDLRALPDGPNVTIRAESAATGQTVTTQVAVLSPPVIVADGAATGGGVHGTAYPGARVTVTADSGATCQFPADSSGAWGCVLTGSLPDGRHTVTATQVAPFSSTRSAASAPVAILVDTAAPAAPTITAPAPGATVNTGDAMTFAGGGEEGGSITVYANTSAGATVACTAQVTGGAWSCSGTLPEGGYLVTALQRDAAGNISPGSNTVAVTVARAGAPAAPPATRTPKPTPTPTPTPAPTTPPGTALPAPPAGGEHPGTKGWIDTPFSTASAPVVSVEAFPGWLRSALLALAAVVLLVLPARLLAGTIARGRAAREAGGESPRRRSSIFGRNRARGELGEADALLGRRAEEDSGRASAWGAPATRGDAPGSSAAAQPVWLAPVTGVLAAALVTLSTSVKDPGAYVRLLIAVALAIVLVNAVWVLAARAMARRLRRPLPTVAVRPALLVLVAVAAIGSRLFGLAPALLFGLVLGVVVAPEVGRVARGSIAAVQVSATAALGVLAWLLTGVLPAPSGAISAFVVECANALAMVGIGSSAIALLPLGGLAGRAVFQWSRLMWTGLSLVVFTLLFALLLPVASLVENGTGMIAATVVALAFAVLSVSAWLWERYVEPAR
ncbi:Ig-like domain-containing protein [Leifsonia sp. LS1]|uniref:Ig-like domain-containing protein n=1 Tax=Leifsonia sp. LS1 TaxID=2828483 RepID=UPI001CFCD99F|nr:Ig-like domain-containing protein [Leifsonia sp. LS1]